MQSTPLWRFGPFEADATEHQLRREGAIVPVTRKSFALLATLLSRPGKLFTKAELFDTVWAGTVVSDAALSRAIRELRVALDDDASAPRYIATAHGLGFRFIAEIVGEPGARGDDVRAHPPASTLLVARAAELALLDAALAAARAGKRELVFITGEAGIGKTALVEAFLTRQAGREDLWMTQGRCVEQYGPGEAFLPILEALENLTRQVGAAPLRDLLARCAPSWLAQLPWLARPGEGSAAKSAAGATTAQGMLREIAHALEELAARTLIVLWLEDLHWSDPSTLSVVSFIAGRREPARLLVVASFRPAEARSANSPLQGLALRLVQRHQAQALDLPLLDTAAIVAYLRGRFGADAEMALEALGGFLHRRTEGNALFVVAIVDDLIQRKALDQRAGTWSLRVAVRDLDSSLPESLRQLVHHQIEQLTSDERRMVEAAAVAGTDFSAASVAAALAADTAEIEDRLTLLAEQGRFFRQRAPVAWPDGTVASGFAFVHALYWRDIAERVTQTRRAEWQGRIGAREEAAHRDHCAPIAAQLAMRFEQAGDAERSLRYGMVAAASALHRSAYLECISLCRQALQVLRRLPADQQLRREFLVLLPLGAALMAAQGYASGEAETTYRRALELCREYGEQGDLARVLRGLWNVVFIRADLARAGIAAQELLEHAATSARPDLAFDAWTKLGQTSMHRGDFAVARQRLEQALSLPVSASDQTRLRESPRAAAYLAWVHWYSGEPDRALVLAEQALSLASESGSAHSNAFVFGFVSWLHLFRGELALALALAQQQHALCIEHGLVYWQLWAEFTIGLLEVRKEQAMSSADAMRCALKAMRSTGVAVGVPHFLCLLAERELAAGRLLNAAADLLEAETLLAQNGNAQHAAEAMRLRGELALMEGGAGARQDAQRCFEAALAIARAQGARSLELRAASSLARLWAVDGLRDKAEALLAPVLAAFDEGLQTADLIAAKAVLDTVRAAAAISRNARR